MSDPVTPEPTAEPIKPAPRSVFSWLNLGAGAPGDSDILGVSIRCWIALLLIVTLCALALMGRIGGEAFIGVAAAVTAFYFNRQPPAPKP